MPNPFESAVQSGIQTGFNTIFNDPERSKMFYGFASNFVRALTTGNVNVQDDTGSFSIGPGGAFNLTSNKGWSVTGNPSTSSAGVQFNKPWGMVGVSGSWDPNDKRIQADFKVGGNKQEPETPFNAGQTVESALLNLPGYQQPTETRGGISPQEFLQQQIEKQKASDDRWYAR